ncbi:MAG: hypothetical protein M0003_12425 [Acidithiobacillus sp.]|nr:hypothetical protein [Acidithiobacillus sp.]
MSAEKERQLFDAEPDGLALSLFTPLSGLSDVEADHYLVRRCAEHMTAKLALSRAKGRGGWHTPRCDVDHLHRMLREHVEKGDMVDVLNLAGMILVRQSCGRQESYGQQGASGQQAASKQTSLPDHQACLGPTGGPGTKAEKVKDMLESYNWTTQTAGCADEASGD